MSRGLFFGKFAPLTTGHISAIQKAATLVDELFVVMCWDQKFQNTLTTELQKVMTKRNRLMWLKDTFKHMSKIRVLCVDESPIQSYPDGSEDFTNLVRNEIFHSTGCREAPDMDKVFSSETEYSEYFQKYWHEAEHVLIDPPREFVDISATRVRANPYEHWDKLAPAAHKHFVKKVCIIGVESCVDGNTEFFNGSEWKFIKDYVEGDRVLQFSDNRIAELIYPERYIKEPCESMYMMNNTYKTWTHVFSDQHNVVYETSKGNIQKTPMSRVVDDHFNKPNGFRGKFLCSFNYEGTVSYDEHLLRLMIAISAEGSLYKKQWRIRLIKERKIERMRELISNVGIELDERVYQDGSHNFYVPVDYGVKIFPSDFYHLDKKTKDVFLSEIFLWDGSVVTKTETYFSKEYENVKLVQFILSSSGFKTSITKDKIDCYSVLKNKTNCLSISLNDINRPKRNEMITKFIPEDGFKYCFSVPSGMLVLRRDDHIFITGNCGKSTLTINLANHFSTQYVEEVGRTICENEYHWSEDMMNIEDYVYVAMEHKVKEHKVAKTANKVMFSDTNNLITLFSAECMGKRSSLLSQMAHAEDYDLVIMLDIDVPWVYDPLRLNFSPERRAETHDLLKFLCKAHGVKYHLISGSNYDDRFKTAVHMVQNLLQGTTNEHTGD